jgi:hypothetical protein
MKEEFNEEMKTLNKKSIEILEMKSSMSLIKSSTHSLTNQMDHIENRYQCLKKRM